MRIPPMHTPEPKWVQCSVINNIPVYVSFDDNGYSFKYNIPNYETKIWHITDKSDSLSKFRAELRDFCLFCYLEMGLDIY